MRHLFGRVPAAVAGPPLVCCESADGQVNPCMMKAGPHTNPAAPARHRPPSPPRGNDRKALQLSATPPVREEAIAGTPNLDAAVSSSRTRDDLSLIHISEPT